MFGSAVKAHKSGQIEKARQLYLSILKADPNHPDAHHNLGILYFENGDIAGALTFFKKATALSPKISQFWISFVKALIIKGDLQEARTNLKKAKKRGVASDILKQLKGEIVSASKSRSDGFNEPDIGKLRALFKNGRFLEVIREASPHTERFPKLVGLFDLLGASNLALSRLAEAKKYYLRAAEIEPSASIYNQLGNTLGKLGDLDGAIINYMKAIEIDPDLLQLQKCGNSFEGVSVNRSIDDSIVFFSNYLRKEISSDPLI